LQLEDSEVHDMKSSGYPVKKGLYDTGYENDACGIGYVANIKGKKSNDILRKALTALDNLDHRGARGAELNTGDGAGILMQIPHEFFRNECEKLDIHLPSPGNYGIGMLFLSTELFERNKCERELEKIIREEGQVLLGWRNVPTDDSTLGETAKFKQPRIRQVFIAKNTGIKDDMDFERKLYIIRKRAENEVRANCLPEGGTFYFASFSSRTIVYKGMLIPEQIAV